MEKTEKTANAVLREFADSIIGSRPSWWPDWNDETVALIASGPTAKKANVAALKDRTRVIAINESYQLAPWADVLYACDPNWWKLKNGAPEFHGLKICAKAVPVGVHYEDDPCKYYSDLKQVEVDRYSNEIKLHERGRIGAGGNSGFQALNLAVQFGVSKIILVGFDMRVDLGGAHWHRPHPMPLSNPHPNDNIPRWRTAIDGAAKILKKLDVDVINCSAVSLLTAYRKMTIEEALQCP